MTLTAAVATYPTPADLAQLRETPVVLAERVAGLPDAALRERTTPGEWCVAELIGHLLDNERVYRRERFGAILAAAGATFTGYDQEAMVRDGGYATAEIVALLRAFADARAETLALLAVLTPEQWRYTGTRRDRGTFTVAGLAGMLAAHDRTHLAQIAEAVGDER